MATLIVAIFIVTPVFLAMSEAVGVVALPKANLRDAILCEDTELAGLRVDAQDEDFSHEDSVHHNSADHEHLLCGFPKL